MHTALVVDDDQLVRELLGGQLMKLGFRVSESSSGRDVLEKIALLKPDLVLLDMLMDENDGIETLLALSRFASKPRLIAISRSKPFLEVAIELGADAYLLKPIIMKELSVTISEMGIGLSPAKKEKIH